MEQNIKEFKIENLSQINSIIEEIKEVFKKDTNETITVRFDNNITENDLLESLKVLWQYEIDSNNNLDISIKNLSYDYRKKALSLALKTTNLKDLNFLMNVFCLIKGYNTFDEGYFKHEKVFINDEVEFLDIFDDLDEEIKEVTKNVVEYYISMIKTCNLVEVSEDNPNAVKLDNLYSYLFNSFDVTILAKLVSSVKDLSVWETKKIVINSLGYLGQIAEKFVFANNIMSLIGNELMQKCVKEVLDNKE